MNFKDCINFANKVKDCSMATTEGNQPRVRMMGLWFADESGFYFQAWTFKDVCKDLKGNPKTEVCFHDTSKERQYDVMRIRGSVEFLEDQKLKEKLWQDRQFLKGLGAEGPDDPRLAIFRIAHGQVSFWPLRIERKYPELDMVSF